MLAENGIREPLYLTAMRYAGIAITPEKRPAHVDTVVLDDADTARLHKWFHALPLPEPGPAPEHLLEVRGLGFGYTKGQSTLHDISFTIGKGEMVSIVGRNGAGKSTLAKLICGFETPEQGQVLLDGRDLAQDNIRRRAQHIGYVMQNPNQMISKTMIFEEVALALQGSDMTQEQIRQRVEDTLKVCGLYPFRNWPISALSFGQKKRVTIASVLVQQPELIILDEPTVGLDPAQMIEIRNLIHDLGETHTVILSSHILSEVQTICDRVLIIAHGKVAAQGTPEELAAQLAARGMIAATALGTKEQILAAAAKVEGLTDLRVTAEKGDEVSFTATSTAGADLRAALSKALAEAGCPVVSLTSDTMSLEDIFLQITETAPEEAQPEETEEPAPEAAAAQPEQSAEPAEPQAPADYTPEQPEAENDQKEEE